MSGHLLPFRLSRKCSKLITSAALLPRSRVSPAPQIRFGWAHPGPVITNLACVSNRHYYYIFPKWFIWGSGLSSASATEGFVCGPNICDHLIVSITGFVDLLLEGTYPKSNPCVPNGKYMKTSKIGEKHYVCMRCADHAHLSIIRMT